jgi:hypothetical protein
MKIPKRPPDVSLSRMLDAEDRKVLGGIVGLGVLSIGALSVMTVAGAGILGLAIRVFQLAAGG